MSKGLLKKINMLKDFQKHTVEDLYDEGYYNGIELALSLLEERKANYKWTVRDKTKE